MKMKGSTSPPTIGIKFPHLIVVVLVEGEMMYWK